MTEREIAICLSRKIGMKVHPRKRKIKGMRIISLRKLKRMARLLSIAAVWPAYAIDRSIEYHAERL